MSRHATPHHTTRHKARDNKTRSVVTQRRADGIIQEVPPCTKPHFTRAGPNICRRARRDKTSVFLLPLLLLCLSGPERHTNSAQRMTTPDLLFLNERKRMRRRGEGRRREGASLSLQTDGSEQTCGPTRHLTNCLWSTRHALGTHSARCCAYPGVRAR